MKPKVVLTFEFVDEILTLHMVGEPAVRAAAKTVLSCFICQSFCSVARSDLFRLYLNEVVIPILFCAGGREFKPHRSQIFFR